MNAYELVQQWIDEGKTFVSRNEVATYNSTGRIAVAILQEEYKAKVVEGDGRFCGGWSFHNPNAKQKSIYRLYSCYHGDNEFSSISNTIDTSIASFDHLIEEIVRLEFDDIYWKRKEKIPAYVNMIKNQMSGYHNYYIGKERIWKIQTETIWTTY